MRQNVDNFIQQNSPDEALKHTLQGKDFLQSEEWRIFQESVGRKTYNISGNNFWANIVEHRLPIVGRYFYVPRGPVIGISNFEFRISNQAPIFNDQIRKKIVELISLAKKNKAGWVRIDVNSLRILDLIRSNWRVVKAPHDMQARQIFIIDISKPEEELLARMKPKTRYNIRLAQRKGVSLRIMNLYETTNKKDKNIEEFLRLVKVTSERNKIKSHSENYYRKMLKISCVKLYAAEYQGKMIAADLVSFYGGTATYLHGASDNKYRNVMAPFLLQWRAMLDAKKAGCRFYDLGGIFTNYESDTNILITNNEKKGSKKIHNTKYIIPDTKWVGITRFKLGFSPKTKPVEFPGSYDIIISPIKYWLYKILQRIKEAL